MKKRMFLSTILMTLVLLVAVTTATFAWYSAAKTGKSVVDATDDTVSTAANELGVGNIVFTASITHTGAPHLTTTSGVTKKIVGGNPTEVALQEVGLTDRYATGSVVITATYDKSDVSFADAWAGLDELTIYLYIEAGAGNAKTIRFLEEAPTALTEAEFKGGTYLTYEFTKASFTVDTVDNQLSTVATPFYYAITNASESNEAVGSNLVIKADLSLEAKAQ